MQQIKDPTIPEIDGLRGFLALYVLLFHINSNYQFENGLEWLSRVFKNGGSSPYLFFIISGFLLIKSYSNLEYKNNIFTFYLRRVFRILPTYWVILALTLLLIPQSVDKSLIGNAFFLFGFQPYSLDHLIVLVSWSLFVEEIYYICIPFISRYATLKRIGFGYLFFLTTFYLWTYFVGKNQYFGGLRWDTPLTTFHFLFAGIGIYKLQTQFSFSKLLNQKWFSVFLDISAFALILVFSLTDKVDFSILGSLLLVSALVKKSLFSKFFWQRKVLQFLGKRCYSIYLTQILTIFLCQSLWRHWSVLPGHQSTFYFYVLAVTLTLTFSEVIHRLIEKPFTKLGRSFKAA